MPITAEGIRELMGLGISQDQLAAVVAIFERDAERHASRSASRDGRDGMPTKAAIRSRNYRVRLKGGDTSPSRDASRSERDAAPILSEVKKDKGLQDEEERKAKRESARARAVLLPADFQPKQSHFDAARGFGRDDQFVRDKFEDMRLWAESNGARKVNWDSTLHGFIRRDAKGQGNGNRTSEKRTNSFARSASPGADTVLAGMGRIAGRIHERRISAGCEREVPPSDDDPGFIDLEPVRTRSD